jgi:hypothetical protein
MTSPFIMTGKMKSAPDVVRRGSRIPAQRFGHVGHSGL